MATISASEFFNEEDALPAVRVGFFERAIVWGLVFCVVFVNAADFRGDTGEKFAVHWQIYLRLMICAICGCAGIVYFSKTYREFLTMPGMMISFLVAWIGITVPFSIDKSYSMAAYISLGSVVAMVPAAMQILGGYRYLAAVLAGLMTYLIGSWIAYLFFPDIGIFKEQVTTTDVVERMGGLGHPNELGFYSAFTITLLAAFAYGKRLPWLVAGPAILFAMLTLAVCFSRTSMAITVVGLLVVYRAELFKVGTILWALAIPLVVIPIVFVVIGSGDADWMIQDFGRKISKSGSSDELSTATGRTEIWAYGIEKIGEEPLKGYGYGTARFVMEDHSYHCHNIVLNMSMYTGIIGGGIVLMLIFYFLYQIFHNPRYEVDGLISIILVGGMVEGMLVSPVPHVTIMIWVSALFWRQLNMSFNPGLDSQRRLDAGSVAA